MDLSILRFINLTVSNRFLDSLFVVACDFNIWRWPIIMIAVALLWKGGAKGRWATVLALIAIMIIDPSVYRLIKPVVGRLRPCHEPALDWVRTVAGCGGLYGFPSSHAANTFGLALIYSAFYRRTAWVLYPLAALVSIGRVYLGVHYPSDILAGAIYGSIIALAVILVSAKLAGERVKKYYSAEARWEKA